MRNVEAWRGPAPIDTTPVVAIESLEAGTSPPDATTIPTDTSTTPSTSTVFVPHSISRPPLTQAMLYQMGNLAHSVVVRASRVEVAVPSMIFTDIEDALSPVWEVMTGQHALLTTYGLQFDTLTAQVEERERAEGSSADLAALSDDIGSLRRNVKDQKSTYI